VLITEVSREISQKYNMSAARDGVDIVEHMLGEQVGDEMKDKMATVLVRVIDKVCEQQLDSRLGNFLLYAKQQERAAAAVSAVDKLADEVKALKITIKKSEDVLLELTADIIELENKYKGLEQDLRTHMIASANGAQSMSNRLNDVALSTGTKMQECKASLDALLTVIETPHW